MLLVIVALARPALTKPGTFAPHTPATQGTGRAFASCAAAAPDTAVNAAVAASLINLRKWLTSSIAS